MKLNQHANKLQTNVQGETQNFGIGDVSVVIDILQNRLYENKIQTLVQEYICNARDAHRELGKGNEFEITIPNELNPTFKVRDFGPGISPDRMANVFVLYGASTKRDSNTQTGGFGIGAKSAWAYTDSFTIVTVIDGLKRSYVAHTGVNNNGRLDLVETVKTTEKNGTEIQIAVKRQDVREFRDSVLRAIYFWENKPTLKGWVNTDQDFKIVSGYKLGTIELVNSGQLPNFTGESHTHMPAVIVDGVIYPVSQKLLDKCKVLEKLHSFCKRKIVIRVNNGVVEVSASRESIADSRKSVDALESIAQKATAEIKAHIKEEFDKAKTTVTYLQTFRTLFEYFPVDVGFAKFGKYTINGNSLQSELFKTVSITEVHCLGRYGRGRVNKVTKKVRPLDTDHIPFDTLSETFFVKTQESAVAQNKRIREHLKTVNKLFILEVIPSIPRADGTVSAVVSQLDQIIFDLGLKDIQSIFVPPVPKELKVKIERDKREFCMHSLTGERYRYLTLADNEATWLYVPVSEAGWGYPLEELRELNEYLGNTRSVNICGLADRAIKMVEGDKNFSPLKDWLDGYTPSQKEILTVKRAKAKNGNIIDILENLKAIKDTEVFEMMEEYKAFAKLLVELPAILLKKVEILKEVKEFEKEDGKFAGIVTKRYPLISEIGSYSVRRIGQELVFYMNAKFESDNK